MKENEKKQRIKSAPAMAADIPVNVQGAAPVSSKTRKLAQIGMLSAIAATLMFFEIPMPFIAPPFYKFDFSEIPVLIGAFAMGPAASIAIEAFKIILKMILKGTTTMGVGELGNFLIGLSFILPAGMLYRWRKNRKTALAGLLSGTVFMTVVGCIVNAFILLPAYVFFMGFSMDDIIAAGAAIHPSVNGVFSFVVMLVAPFNIIKGIMASAIVLLIYKRISRFLKSW